jgi:hypothetical protein
MRDLIGSNSFPPRRLGHGHRSTPKDLSLPLRFPFTTLLLRASGNKVKAFEAIVREWPSKKGKVDSALRFLAPANGNQEFRVGRGGGDGVLGKR